MKTSTFRPRTRSGLANASIGFSWEDRKLGDVSFDIVCYDNSSEASTYVNYFASPTKSMVGDIYIHIFFLL